MKTPTPSEIRTHSESVLERQFCSLGTGAAVTRGHYELDGDVSVADLDWNHMDQEHRPYIHDTYHESVRIASARDFALSVTRLGRLPFLAQVTDIRLGPGHFYQSVSLLGIAIVHSTIRMTPLDNGKVRQDIDWMIVTHRLFRFVHGWLNRRMQRLNAVQNVEDIPVRDRRTELRRRGWRFRTDDPDFLNSNTSENNAIPPAVEGELREAIPEGAGPHVLCLGAFEFLVRRVEDGVHVWPGVCPHEGGNLCEGARHGDRIECPWHGFRFGPVRLTAGEPVGDLFGVRVRFDGDALIVLPGSE